jgi:hypothetical protein
MLMRNLAPGWTNGKRVVIQSIAPGGNSVVVVDAKHWNEEHGANHQYPYEHRLRLCRVDFDWKISAVGMTVVRKQFPMRLAYAVTYNKSQGQTLERCVVDVRNPAFAHGQEYTAFSRAMESDHMRILCMHGQVKRSDPEDPDTEYVAVVNYVERKMLENTMPEEQRQQMGAVPPDPPPPGAAQQLPLPLAGVPTLISAAIFAPALSPGFEKVCMQVTQKSLEAKTTTWKAHSVNQGDITSCSEWPTSIA